MKAVQSLIASPTALCSRLQTGFAWNLVGAVFNQGSTFAFNIFAANILGLRIFGEFAMIQSTIVTLAAIAQFGMGTTAAKHLAEFRSVDKEKAGRILGLCSLVSTAQAIVASVALLAAASWLAASVLKEPHLSSEIMIAAAVVLFSAMNFFLMGALSGLENYRSLGLAGIIGGCVYLATCCGAAWLWGLQGALAGLAASAMIQWLILRRLLRVEGSAQGITTHYRHVWHERGILFEFAIPAAISGLSTLPALWLGNTFLVRQPGGYPQMALYSAANNLRVMVMFLPGILNSVCMSLLNNEKGLNNKAGFLRLFWMNIALSGGFALIGAGLVVLFGPLLLHIFGKDFAAGYGVLFILMLSTIPEALAVASFQNIQAHGRMWLSLYAVALPRDALMVVLSYLMVPVYGAAGLALAYMASWIIALFVIAFVNRALTLWGRKPICC